MLSKLKFKIRRIFQKISGLDVDNAEFQRLRAEISVLEQELNRIKNEFLYNSNLIPEVENKFVVPEQFFDEENRFVTELANLGLYNINSEVLEIKCSPGSNAHALIGKVKKYIGYESSEVSIKVLSKKFPNAEFVSDLKEIKSKFDLIIISPDRSKWSKLSLKYFLDISKDLVKNNGSIIVELPYQDHIEPGFEKLRYPEVTFLVTKNNNLMVSNLS